jgi:hydrogenase maturation protein HypF
VLGPHSAISINPAHFDRYTRSIELLERFLDVQPKVVAHDLHPDYLSRPTRAAVPSDSLVAVQHHHAHVVSAMAGARHRKAHDWYRYDGTGYGTDGTIVGRRRDYSFADGGLVSARRHVSRRCAGRRRSRDIQEPWRIALCRSSGRFGGELRSNSQPAFGAAPIADLVGVKALLTRAAWLPRARGRRAGTSTRSARSFWAGRNASYEGQVALEWNQAADPRVTARLPI